MALNLGPIAFEAVQRLKNNEDWRSFVDALEAQMGQMMHAAIECEVGHRQDATGYARGLRDVVATIALMERAPGRSGPMPKPAVRMKVAVE
jgi:hypothetical protein